MKNWLVANVGLFIPLFGLLIGLMFIIAPDATDMMEDLVVVLLILIAGSLVFAGFIATYAYRNFDDVVSRRMKYRHSKAELQSGRFAYWLVIYFYSLLALLAGSFLLLMIIGAIFG